MQWECIRIQRREKGNSPRVHVSLARPSGLYGGQRPNNYDFRVFFALGRIFHAIFRFSKRITSVFRPNHKVKIYPLGVRCAVRVCFVRSRVERAQKYGGQITLWAQWVFFVPNRIILVQQHTREAEQKRLSSYSQILFFPLLVLTERVKRWIS